MVGDFGDKFRKAREVRELSLDDVSNVTKISARMLRAIEEEHFDDLPGGVFNKGFIRAYAKHLGLDAEEAVSDYLASLRQAQIDAHEVWEPQTPAAARHAANGGKAHAAEAKKPVVKPSAPKPATPVGVEELPELHLPRAEDVRPTRKEFLNQSTGGIPRKIVAAAALVAALGIFLWVRHANRIRISVPSPEKVASAPIAQPVAALAPSGVTPTPPTAALSASKPGPSPVSTQPSNPAPNQASTQTPVKTTATSPAATSSSSPAPENSDPAEVTVKTSVKSTPKTSAKTAPALSLVIRATKNSWISVFSDGQFLTQETLIAPAQTSVRGSREISVRIGNAAGVSFTLNGQEFPAQGSEAEVKNFVFDSSGMHITSASPSSAPIP
jgi:cytoskeleton protein RodZ